MVCRRIGDAGLHRAPARRRPPRPNASPPRPWRSVRWCTPPLRFALQTVHGAAVFDRGDRAGGLAELQRARSEFGDLRRAPSRPPRLPSLEFRAALLLGHATAARTVLGLADRAHRRQRRAAAHARLGRGRGRPPRTRARRLIRPVLDGSAPALLPHTLVDAWLLETVDRDRRRRTARGPPRPADRPGPRRAPRRPPPVRPGRTRRPRTAGAPARQLRSIRRLRAPGARRRAGRGTATEPS